MQKKIRKSFEEQETIINIDPPQISKTASYYTTIPSDIKAMWNLQKKYPDIVEVVADDKWGSEFKIPAAWITIKPKKELSEEQKQVLVERLSKRKGSSKQKKS